MVAWQFTYDGLVFGDGTDIDVVDIQGLDLPDMRTSDQDVPGSHGLLAGLDRLAGRTVTLGLNVFEGNETDLYASLHALSKATGPRDVEFPLSFQVGNQTPMRVMCRPRRRNVPVTWSHLWSFVPASVQFEASDPLIYSDAELMDTATAALSTAGWSYDRSYDWSYGTDLNPPKVAHAYNEGTAPTWWRAAVVGPCASPTIYSSAGGAVSWNGSLAAGETLIFDSHPSKRTVAIDGTASRYLYLDAASTWFPINPGLTDISLASSDGNGTMTLYWRHAWWSAT